MWQGLQLLEIWDHSLTIVERKTSTLTRKVICMFSKGELHCILCITDVGKGRIFRKKLRCWIISKQQDPSNSFQSIGVCVYQFKLRSAIHSVTSWQPPITSEKLLIINEISSESRQYQPSLLNLNRESTNWLPCHFSDPCSP